MSLTGASLLSWVVLQLLCNFNFLFCFYAVLPRFSFMYFCDLMNSQRFYFTQVLDCNCFPSYSAFKQQVGTYGNSEATVSRAICYCPNTSIVPCILHHSAGMDRDELQNCCNNESSIEKNKERANCVFRSCCKNLFVSLFTRGHSFVLPSWEKIQGLWFT